ncbi:NHS-like protein 1 isoform X3 [Pleurodeles waltl]|uniref:NHS-like protein 1 isoform X3 n=1 Tax=Pleurodeles waltl TaxID=8319 RepID=UPI00370961EF
MKKDSSSSSLRHKGPSGSLSRAVSWLNFSSLSRQTKRLFRSDGELSAKCGPQEEDDERWTYKAESHRAVSNLDEESKWTVHYTAPWHHQENVFLPSSRPPCVEELHQQAKVNLKSVLRECDKLRRDGYRSSQYYSQGPTFSSSGSPRRIEDEEEEERKSSVSSAEEENLLGIKRPKTPVPDELADIHTQTNWTKSLPLPTPEEKMRQQAQAVLTDVVPINVTGENFDRQASIRRSLVYTDTVVRRPKKVKRRKTITGVPDNIQKELAAGIGQNNFRGHSLYIPDHYATLGKLETCRSSSQRLGTRDTSCQTDEVKVVPPSVRRIRAQKGQGIAAQMSHMSSSSGNMSTVSDSAGVLLAPRFNGEMHFHSLPRPGARVSLQSLDHKPSPLYLSEGSAQTMPCQISKLQVDDSVVHMRNSPRNGTLPRPKSQEVRSGDKELSNPACVVSPHAAYSMSVIPNATLSATSEVIVLHTSMSMGQLDNKLTSASSYTRTAPGKHPGADTIKGAEDHHSSSGNWSESSSNHHSQASDTAPSNVFLRPSLIGSSASLSAAGSAINRSQSMTYSGRNNLSFPTNSLDSDDRSESSYSEGRGLKTSISSTENWVYEPRVNGGFPSQKMSTGTPGNSTPVSNMSISSYEGASVRADSSSLCSLDPDGYYTTMHVDSGLRSQKQCRSNSFENTQNGQGKVCDVKGKQNNDEQSSYSDRSLTRSISLKKSKKPPLPPSRTDSLRRAPKKKTQSNGQVLNETLIATLQQSLQLNLKYKNSSSPSQSPCSDYEDPWIVRSRSQSTVSASSSGLSTTAPNMYSICPVTPSQSESSSSKSEHADPWGYYINYTGNQEEQTMTPASCPINSTVSLNNCRSGQFSYESGVSVPQVSRMPANPKNASPEKSHRVTSPSSGYSSQSNTPTALTPVPLFLKNMSPGNGKVKLKPKVPERKSSLVSTVSISSSSTSLSSNTSDSLQPNGKSATCAVNTTSPLPHTPDPPPPPSPLKEVLDLAHPPSSPSFPPPPPETMAYNSAHDELHGFLHTHATGSNSLAVPSMGQSTLSPTPAFKPPIAPPLHPKLIKDAMKQPNNFKQSLKEMSSGSSPKCATKNQDTSQPPVPLVTTQALQKVQLRSVKKSPAPELDHLEELASEPAGQEKLTAALKSSWQPSASEEHKVTVGDSETESAAVIHLHLPRPHPGQYHKVSDLESSTWVDFPEQHVAAAFSAMHICESDEKENLAERSGSSEKTPSPDQSPSKKPPPISKKPKLFLIVPPPQLDLAASKETEVHENVRSLPSVDKSDSVSAHWGVVEDGLTADHGSDETGSNGVIPNAGAADPTSWDMGDAKVSMSPSASQPEQDAQGQDKEEELTLSDDGSSSDGIVDSSTTADEHLQTEDEHAEVFESEDKTPTLSYSTFREGMDDAMTPSRPRTTEDLFAAIHRSKRKVLGRKDSDDDRSRNHSPSPPVTPTGAGPNMTFKQMGSIQRSLRKTATSSDNFKALLLKKGSRNEYSSRMSAAEMLKNTDPRFQRSRSESSPDLPESPTFGSPSKNKRAQEEWAKNEGLMPRSMSLSSTRYGRSRTPPLAASSKYNMRSRIQSSPMTVICEGDGEAADAVDGGSLRTLQNKEETLLGGLCRTDMDSNDSFDADEAHVGTPVSRDLMAAMMMGDTSETCPSQSAEES